MVLVHDQKFYEKYTGDQHRVEILFDYIERRCYTVFVDGEFYSTNESKREAYDEAEDIIKCMNWSPLRPF